MTPEYAAFLASKAPRAHASGIAPRPMNPMLFDFQAAASGFCIEQGRAALFLDTGLGKTVCQLEFLAQAVEATNLPAILFTPLAVARQIEREAEKFGYDARVVRGAADIQKRINICNYDRLHLLDTTAFGGVSLDESSIIKSFTGSTTRALMAAFSDTRFRLCATATPAPNDHMELGQHSQFLGAMRSNEMLARWFISDQTEGGRYRLKGHGEESFWDWMASWSRAAETPADLGFDGSRFVLPELSIVRHKAIGEVKPMAGALFAADVSATNIHYVKRQTAEARADVVGAIVGAGPDEAWVIWCDTDYEADALKRVLPGAVEVRGSQSIEQKEQSLADFAEGRARIIITKPKIGGFGCNWQHAARQVFVGRSFSYEAWYQCVRRSWRFGQTRPVVVHIIVAEGEDQIGRVIDRKAADHAKMKRAMAAAMRRAVGATSAVKIPYNPTHIGRLPEWLKSVA